MPHRALHAHRERCVEVVEMVAALSEQHASDAHLVAYVVPSERAIHRLTVDGERPEGLCMEVLLADIDTPGHQAWPSDAAAIDALGAALEVAGSAGGYVTRGGLRLVQPLDRRLGVDDGEAALRGWYAQLERGGLGVDWRCAQWTRLFRAPHVRRDGARYVSPRLELERMTPIAPPGGSIVRRRSPGGALPEVAWCEDIPPHVERLVAELAPVVAAERGQRHEVALALSGALLGRGVRPEHLPAVVARLALLSGDEEPADRVAAARDTARRYLARRRVRGLTSLADIAPAVARVLAPLERRAVEARAEAGGAMSAADAGAALLESLRQRRPGVRLIEAGCGVGKTHAMRLLAAERASAAHATPGPHTRAPRGSRTAISVPTHELAQQIVADLRAAGVDAARVYGPLAVRGAGGLPVCQFHASGQALAAGGQSVRRELCEGRGRPCQYRDTCSARDGVDGSPSARVLVGPHALVAELAEAAGATGLLAIDEPPALVQHQTVTAEQLDEAALYLSRFSRRYADAVAPLLSIVRHWLDLAPLDEPHALERALELGSAAPHLEEAAYLATGECDTRSQAAAASERPTDPPLLDAGTAFACRLDQRLAQRVGQASRVVLALRSALLSPATSSCTVVESGGRRRLEIASLDERLLAALTRDGETVVAAADVAIHAGLYERALGYAPPLERYAAADGAPVRRVLVEERATRTAWATRSGLDIEAVSRALGRALALIPREVAGATVRVCLVTYPAVEAVVREALGLPAGGSWPASRERLDEAARALSIVLDGRDVVVSHYGAVRGLDHWKERDALVTLGDPWPPLDVVERELGVLGVPAGVDGRARRAAALAAAELEQAHGRLRAPHRRTPGLAVHVGSLLPAGWPADVERVVEGGDRDAVPLPTLRDAVEAAGGARAAARLLGVAERSVRRWCSGEARPPPTVCAWVRSVPS